MCGPWLVLFLGIVCFAGSNSLFMSEVWARQTEEQRQAQAFVDVGVSRFRAKNYRGAAEAFRRAQELWPIPLNLFNIARCMEEMELWEATVEAYDDYIAAALGDPGESERLDRAERSREESTRKAFGSLTVDCPGGALVQLGEFDGVSCPLEMDRMLPGSYSLHVRRLGHEDFYGTVQVDVGRHIVVPVQMVVQRVEPDPREPGRRSLGHLSPSTAPRKGRGPGAPFWAASSVALAAGATGAVFGVLARGAKAEFDGSPYWEDKVAFRDQSQSRALVADICFGVAGAAAITGLLFWVGGSRSQGVAQNRQSPSIPLAFSIQNHGVAIAVDWGF